MNEITNILLKDANIRKLLNTYKTYVIAKYKCAINEFLNFKKQFDSTPESRLENFAPAPGIKVNKREMNAYMQVGIIGYSLKNMLNGLVITGQNHQQMIPTQIYSTHFHGYIGIHGYGPNSSSPTT